MPASCAWAETVLERVYAIRGEASPLPGEFDDNFLIRAADGTRRVLKIMRPGCDASFIDLQQRVIECLAGAAPVPRLIFTAAGRAFEEVDDRLVWLLSWIDGDLLADWKPRADPLLRD